MRKSGMKAAVALLLVGASVARGMPAKAAIDKGPAGVCYALGELLVALKAATVTEG